MNKIFTLNHHHLLSQIVNATDECPVPCRETELFTTSSFYDEPHLNMNRSTEGGSGAQRGRGSGKGEETGYGPLYSVHIQQNKFDSHDVIQEKQLYTWDQIAGEVGGFLGLLIGVSFVSIVELLAYFSLSIVERCANVTF